MSDSIVKIVQDNCSDLLAWPSFFHGEKWESNLQDENTKFPNTTLDHPIISKPEITKAGNINTFFNLSVLFANKIAQDATQEQVQPVIDAMYAMANEWLLRMFNDIRIVEIKNVTQIEVYRLKDLNVSGVYIYCSVLPFNADGVCLTQWMKNEDGSYVLAGGDRIAL